MKTRIRIRVRIRRVAVHTMQAFGYVAYGAYGAMFKPDDTLAYREWLWEHSHTVPSVPTRSDAWWLD